ncbi:MAG: FHA domain-containing protein [Pseudomonadota bacterium]
MSKLTLSFKGKLLKYFPLREGETVIGSDPGCTVFVDSLAIQAHHARLTLHGDTAILRDLDTTDGTFVNGTRISGEHTLKNGDDIRVGKHNLKLTLEPVMESDAPEEIVLAPVPLEEEMAEEEAEPAETDAPEQESSHVRRHAFLQILNGQNMGKTISLKRNLMNLGKPGVQLAVIAHRNDGFFLSHLEGAPTRVGDQAIGDKAWPLHDGDVIQIGNVRMLFTLH